MARDLVGHARDGLHLEDSLRLRREGDSRLEGVGHAMAAQGLEEVRRPRVDDDLGVWNVDSESVGEEIFAVLDLGK